MKATEQCFPLLLSNLQKHVIQSFESVDEKPLLKLINNSLRKFKGN